MDMGMSKEQTSRNICRVHEQQKGTHFQLGHKYYCLRHLCYEAKPVGGRKTWNICKARWNKLNIILLELKERAIYNTVDLSFFVSFFILFIWNFGIGDNTDLHEKKQLLFSLKPSQEAGQNFAYTKNINKNEDKKLFLQYI